MHHKSIVLRMALPGSLGIQSDPTTVFRNLKTFELQAGWKTQERLFSFQRAQRWN